ncbi:MAG: LacI family DNA-binding transcriptional regulator, partial [Xanthomarina sp.]
MKNRRITLKDLAKDLNLSVSTISRALDNHPAISASTKKIVQEKAEELGFIPNAIASSFRTKKTKSIGIIVPRIDIHFHSQVMSGIADYAYKNDYIVIILQSKDSLKREKEIVSILENRMVDGVIACLSIETKKCDHFKRFEKLGVPLVFYDRVPTDFDANKIVIDDFESAFTATEHLIASGCKKLGHVAGNQKKNIFKARLEGFKTALLKHNLPIQEDFILYNTNLGYDEGVICAKKFLELPELPDGIFCANDYTAVSLIQVFRKANIKIPQQVALMGFSNSPISKIIEPH